MFLQKEKKYLERVKAEILKSGFPLELYARDTILQSGLILSSSKHFLDEDSEKREIDLEASFQIVDGSYIGRLPLLDVLLIECKKNENSPWVFFSDLFVNSGTNFLLKSGNRNELINLARYAPQLKHHHNKAPNIASSYVLPFKSEDSKEARQIYEAISKLVSCYRFANRKLPRNFRSKDTLAFYYHLIVLFEGKLLLATKKDNDLFLKSVRHVVVNHIEPGPVSDSYFVIDIVHRDYLEKYLSKIKAEHLNLQRWLDKHGVPLARLKKLPIDRK